MKLPASIQKMNHLLVGFLVIAIVSSWIQLKRAAVEDDQGDVAKIELKAETINADIRELRKERNDDKTKEDRKTKIDDKIQDKEKDLEGLADDLKDAKMDVKKTMVSSLNGMYLLTILKSLGAIAFGIGLINMFSRQEEHSHVRMAALLILGYIMAQVFLKGADSSLMDSIVRSTIGR